jgi:hypothetical protein
MLSHSSNAPVHAEKGALAKEWQLYGAGLIVLVTTVVIGHILNPHGRRGICRFSDTFEFPLFALSFLLCALAPLWSARPWLRRLALLPAAVLGYVLVLLILLFMSILFGGMPT